MKTIYLTGFMGAGKTTVGEALGKELEFPVIDTDDFIIEKKGKTVRKIFEEEGEATFRVYETEMLAELPRENIVVATGGGIVIKDENRRWMREYGHVIHLACDLPEVKKRVGNDPRRPLLQRGDDFLRTLYQERRDFYLDADYIVDTTNKSVADIIKNIKEWLQENQGIIEENTGK